LEENIDNNKKTITFFIVETGKPGFQHTDSDTYYLTLKTKKGTLTKEISVKFPLTVPYQELSDEKIIIPKLYRNDTRVENLAAIAPVINLD
jgi:hypothetical protein